jgi:cysteine dioxygenase
MKILEGSLTETLYDIPPQTMEGEEHCLRAREESNFNQDKVTYISDSIGLHKVSNSSLDEFAVSLHCESVFPPAPPKTNAQQCTL